MLNKLRKNNIFSYVTGFDFPMHLFFRQDNELLKHDREAMHRMN